LAQDQEEEKKLGWANSADVGIVWTSGNSSTSTFTIDDKLTHGWENALVTVRGGLLRLQTVDDPFAVGTEDDFEVFEDNTRELDSERYYLNGDYKRDINEKLYWIAGAAWQRDTDAGIENLTTLFGGLGNTWRDDSHMRFKTDYAITYTNRIDEIKDPLRDENFAEIRLAYDYTHNLAERVTFDSDLSYFINLEDVDDRRFNMLSSVTTNMTSLLALRFSIQFIYYSLPALEEIDLFNDIGVEIGDAVVRKDKLDSVLRFSLVMTL
jgi:putative salt-induced outer membrane protein YdiY